jgi:hypothetical protein
MQSRKLGAGLALTGIAIAVVLFVVLRDDDGGDGTGSVTPSGGQLTTTDEATGVENGEGEGERPPKPPQPEVAEIVVKEGEPVGGVQELGFTRGERIRFRVRSDVADHVHLHGYDVFMDVPAGGAVEFDVPATLEGVFEVELEDRVVPLAEVTVSPG